MDKNWLIRTKSNHILGPVSKEKVLELYRNGSIKQDDEVCSGNGYWFFIRESDLVERFLTGPEIQGFNPISEAKDVLTGASASQTSQHVPDDITLVGGLNLSMLNPNVPPVPEPPHVPESNKPAAQTPKEPVITETKKKNNVEAKPKAKPAAPKQALKKQGWLKYISILGFVVLLLLIYFRKTIIHHLFQGEITATGISIINVAVAQEDVPEKKKSS